LEREQLGLTATYDPPRSATETRIVAIWADTLEVEPVGLDDDFFELGGDSLSAETLAAALQAEFKLQIQPSQLLELNTPRKLAARVGAAPGRQISDLLMPVNAEAPGDPIFFIHGGGGRTFLRPPFLDGLGAGHPVYMFRAPGYYGEAEPLSTVADVAKAYYQAMKDARPDDEWIIVAACHGIWIATEILRLMQADGRRPRHVIALDPSLPPGERRKDKLRVTLIGRSGIPFVSSTFLDTSMTIARLARQFRGFMLSGRFTDIYSPEAAEIPAIRAYRIGRMIRVHGTDFSIRGNGSADHASPSKAVGKDQAAAWTLTKLDTAFRVHVPKSTDAHVNLIVSEQCRAGIENPHSLFGRLLPNRTFYQSSESHADAVRSSRTARIVRGIIEAK